MELYDGSTWQPQAEMAYDGLGNRLEMTAYAEGQSVNTRYVLDNGQVLAAIAGANSTFYLYGNGPLAELTGAWAYPLTDGSRTARQLVDASGDVLLASSYTPWGDTLSVSGSGSFTNGYFGGIMDSATGLLYLGNGQYYDPATGRFLNRTAQPNPYVPWSGDPLGALMAPLAVMTVVLGRKKKHGKWENIIIVIVLCCSAAIVTTSFSPIRPNPLQKTDHSTDFDEPTQPTSIYKPFCDTPYDPCYSISENPPEPDPHAKYPTREPEGIRWSPSLYTWPLLIKDSEGNIVPPGTRFSQGEIRDRNGGKVTGACGPLSVAMVSHWTDPQGFFLASYDLYWYWEDPKTGKQYSVPVTPNYTSPEEVEAMIRSIPFFDAYTVKNIKDEEAEKNSKRNNDYPPLANYRGQC